MDITADLMVRLRKRPEQWVEAGGAEFLLRMPTREAMQAIYAEAGVSDALERLQFVRVAGPLARKAITGWRGVRLGDIGSSDGLTAQERAADAPFSSELLDLYLADRPDVSSDITGRLFVWLAERRAQEEAERKNS